MKSLFFFALVLAMLPMAITGCTTTEVLRAIDVIHGGIKVIFTDPAVKRQVSVKTMERLVVLDKQYLRAADEVKKEGVENARPLSVIVACADEFLLIIDKLVLDNKYKDKIETMGVSLRVLKNFIQRE